MFLFLEYLKKNTDEAHPVSLQDIRDYFETVTTKQHAKLHAKNSCGAMVKRITAATNEDKYDERDWRVVYDAYRERYSLNVSADAEEEDGEEEKRPHCVRNIYYNPEFSYEELDTIIEAIQFSGALSSKEANGLITKIKDTLASKYYAKRERKVCRIHSVEVENKAELRDKLLLIQQAISKQVRICFTFNGYDQ